MNRRKDKRTPEQRRRDHLTIALAGAIASLLSAVIHEVLKERQR